MVQQAPLSMGFSRQEYWSGSPCPPPWDLPDPRIEPTVSCGSCITGRFCITGPSGKLLLSIVTAPIYNPTNHMQGFSLYSTSTFVIFNLFDNCHSNRCDVAFIFLSLMTSDVDWACNYWPLIYFFWKNVYSARLIFKLFVYLLLNCMYMYIRFKVYKYFFPIP